MINFSAITEKYYLGSTPRNLLDAKRIEQQIKADLVISLQHDVCLKRLKIPQRRLKLFYKFKKINYLRFPIVEFDVEDLENKLIDAVDTAHEAIKNANRVYIHCNQGMERAPSFLVTYLIRFDDFNNIDETIDFVKERRFCMPVYDAIVNALNGVDEH